MNKSELVAAIAAKSQTTQKAADAVLSATLETIMEAVSSGDKVTLVGFGTFEARKRQAEKDETPALANQFRFLKQPFLHLAQAKCLRRR